jgi:hypothetical protein
MSAYQERRRAQKVAALVRRIDLLAIDQGVDPHRKARSILDTIRPLSDVQWRELAVLAGTRPPSDKTIALVLAEYERRIEIAPRVRPLEIPRIPARRTRHSYRASDAEHDGIAAAEAQRVLNALRTCPHCRGRSFSEGGTCEWCEGTLGGPVIKRCSCGRVYDLQAWRVLHLVGFQPDDGGSQELRNCACGSTISRVLVESPEDIRGRLGIEESESACP